MSTTMGTGTWTKPPWAVGTVVLLVAGCTEITAGQWPALPPSAGVVPFTVVSEVHANQQSAIRARQRRVIRASADWESFWAEFHGAVEPKPAVPVIAFDEKMVLVAAMGERTTGGYAISIEGVFTVQATLVVRVEERSPGSNCAVIQVLTAPVTAVVVARSDATVEFVERAVTASCG